MVYIKGEIDMKKILSVVMAASVLFCASAGAFAAQQYTSRGNLTVESDIHNGEDAETASVRGNSSLDITSLFVWTGVSSTHATERKITVTSETGRVEEGTEHPFIPVDVTLRVLNEEAKVQKKYIVGEEKTADNENDGKVSVFEYYTLTVSDDDGVIFEADDIPSDITEIEIPLGLFNYDSTDAAASKNYSDERDYTVSLKVNNNLKRSDVAEYLLPSRWKWYVDAKQQAVLVNGEVLPTPEATDTPEPTADAMASPTVEPETTPAVRATATPRVRTTSTPRATATPKASPKATSSAKATATPKPNPKTGDSAPIAGLSVLGILALAAIAVIQVKKKSN